MANKNYWVGANCNNLLSLTHRPNEAGLNEKDSPNLAKTNQMLHSR